MSNRKSLLAGIKTLNDFDLALLRERILYVSDLTLDGIEKDPASFDRGLITSRQLKISMTNIKKAFDFEKEAASKEDVSNIKKAS